MFLSWTYYCVSCLLTSFRHGTIYNWYSLFHWDPFGPQQGGCFVQCSIACGVAIPCTLFTRRIFSYHVHPIRCLRADGAERVRWNVSSVHDQKSQRSLYKLYIYIYIHIYIHIYMHWNHWLSTWFAAKLQLPSFAPPPKDGNARLDPLQALESAASWADRLT